MGAQYLFLGLRLAMIEFDDEQIMFSALQFSLWLKIKWI